MAKTLNCEKGHTMRISPANLSTAGGLVSVLIGTAISTRAEVSSAAVPTNAPPAGLLPIPNYSGDFWERGWLTGGWGGARTNLANKGVTFGAQRNQYLQSVVDGGRERTTEYGGNWDGTLTLDLLRMGGPKALVKFRGESRYGKSVNGVSGALLPVNSDAFFPLTSKPDKDIAFTITDLNYTQFLGDHFGVFLGKVDTLDTDPNEFASGRGTSQFMNANFVFNPSLALRLPYSTLGAGFVWTLLPPGSDGSVTFSSSIVNTADSSTTTGFEDFDKGQSCTAEVDCQYHLGDLPGGMNVGGLWSFNQDFRQLNSRIVVQPGHGLSVPQKNSTWAAYWSAWQYLFTCGAERKSIDLLNGEMDEKGVGIFARLGFADQDTNPMKWALSGGLGGRGIFPTRDNDTFGFGYYYNSLQTLRLSNPVGLEDSAQGFECFYNIAVAGSIHLTADIQMVSPVERRLSNATIIGLRASVNF